MAPLRHGHVGVLGADGAPRAHRRRTRDPDRPCPRRCRVSILAVIPARGGSKGIPRKNLLEVGGQPLIAWTIAQAIGAGEDVHVVVSTEDAEIAEVAASYGAHIIDRPAELAVDTAPTEPVILHAMDEVEKDGMELEGVMLLQATSPVRHPDTIRRAIDQFRTTGADSLVGVTPQSPFFWHPPTGQDPSARADYDWRNRPRRQDLQPQEMFYFENGSLYLTAPHIYRDTGNRIGGTISLFILDEVEGVDIDTIADVAAAEQMLARIGWTLT
nr:acylneuraminate cytidylyltransferase family protein [Helcobacillus sp. ACRRO]